jgi:hypothetical protein
LLQAVNRFEGQFMKSRAAVSDVIEDLRAHAMFPKTAQVIRDARNRFFSRICGEKQSNLIRHVDHVFGFHG